jgi:ankyrin repeat protein
VPVGPTLATIAFAVACIATANASQMTEKEKGQRLEVYKFLKARSDLATLAAAGDTEKVRELIPAGAQVDEKDLFGRTPLMWAAFFGHTDTVNTLLEASADVNAATRKPTPTNWDDDTFQSIGKASLHKGVTALLEATVGGHQETVEALIQAGADVGARTDTGWTALIGASSLGHSGIVRVLLEAGADVNAKNELGETALAAARRTEHSDVAKLLEEAGGVE